MQNNGNLTFDQLTAASIERCNKSFFPHRAWSVNDYAVAMGGECGEALNVCKKIRRIETLQILRKNKRFNADTDAEIAILQKKLADELGDMIVYAALLATRAGLKLGDCVVNKFNATSDREGSDIKL